MSDVNMKPEANNEIDIVITWVDGNDPAWIAEKSEWLKKEKPSEWDEWTKGNLRFRDWDLLRFWFRGIEQYAPWVRKIHFVTWGHTPAWLNTNHPKIHVVCHDEFIPKKYLPTFNSHAIELNMHRIPDLSNQFIYFNDDMFLMKPRKPRDFFKNGLPCDFAGLNVSFLSREHTEYKAFNAMVINEHFDKHEVISKAPLKWFNPKYGVTCLTKTMMVMAWPRFAGFQTNHLPIPYVKETFDEVWRVEEEILDASCKDKFRGLYAVSPWLMRDWQRVTGKFIPSKSWLGCLFEVYDSPSDKELARISSELRRFKKPMMCLCDYVHTDDGYEKWQPVFFSEFNRRFPKRCSYEMESVHAR